MFRLMRFMVFSLSFLSHLGLVKKRPVVFCLELSEPGYFHFSAATVTPHTCLEKSNSVQES